MTGAGGEGWGMLCMAQHPSPVLCIRVSLSCLGRAQCSCAWFDKEQMAAIPLPLHSLKAPWAAEPCLLQKPIAETQPAPGEQ